MSTSKRFAPKLKIKKGDKVQIIAGSTKGETGVVKEVFPALNKAIVEGLNMVKKHTKAVNENPGGIIEKEAPIHISNMMLVDVKSGKPTRVGRKIVDGKIVRYCKNSGEII
ncbi:MAG: 50S ribosomal protein L24 [Saprospiraceae bacterium]|nr:50S ribosomal protein L24 [Saprospiraceae bacterium]